VGLLRVFRLTLVAHEGEEVAIILPVILLVGAFFIMRWSLHSDKSDDDAPTEVDLEDRPVGLVLPPRKTNEIETREDVSV
jgi:hypothetical protein